MRMARSPRLRHELAGAGEQQVAGEDRDRVAPHGLRARHAAAALGVVHDVVVVERAEVGDLDRLGGGDHVVGDAGAELRGEQREHGAHALAARFEQVARRDIRDRVGEADLVEQARLDALDAVVDRLRHRPVGG